MGRDRWSSLVWLGIAVYICAVSLKLSIGNFHSPGPGFLSFFAGAIMGGLALLVHFQARRSSDRRGGEERKPIWAKPERGRKMCWTVAALLVYAVLMNSLGFLLSTFLFLTFLLKVIEPQRWPVALGGSLIASVVFYSVFELGLQSQLPQGIFKFF
ncbi:MAG TPA: tripartite tricarboxylate transporter TctB family protein [Thermodesulfobacteriota bacterium]|nr:tripartite tricarboxylate transporter TctB family protein [Thermodesulfobacteriota bacterium]